MEFPISSAYLRRVEGQVEWKSSRDSRLGRGEGVCIPGVRTLTWRVNTLAVVRLKDDGSRCAM